MKEIQTEEIQPLLLDALRAFTDYCREEDIPFFMAGGTLLGAVRHQGFIPWDDDVDLFMREEVYDRLLQKIRKNPYADPEKRYRFLEPATTRNAYPYVKLVDTTTLVYEKNISRQYAVGIWLDIFPMSFWPDDQHEAEVFLKKNYRILKLWELAACGNFKDLKYKLLYPFVYLPRKLMLALGYDAGYWGRKIMHLHSAPSAHIGNFYWASSIKDRYPAAWFEKTVPLPFEDLVLDAPSEYDKVLTQFYGDYMTLPPVEKRRHHHFDAYYVDREEQQS